MQKIYWINHENRLNDAEQVVACIEKISSITYPEEYRELVINFGGGFPNPSKFNTSDGIGLSFGRLVSLNPKSEYFIWNLIEIQDESRLYSISIDSNNNGLFLIIITAILLQFNISKISLMENREFPSLQILYRITGDAVLTVRHNSRTLTRPIATSRNPGILFRTIPVTVFVCKPLPGFHCPGPPGRLHPLTSGCIVSHASPRHTITVIPGGPCRAHQVKTGKASRFTEFKENIARSVLVPSPAGSPVS